MTRLDALSQRGRSFLGTRHAIMAGAMTWVSERHLVSAISNAGGFGVIACGSMTPATMSPCESFSRSLSESVASDASFAFLTVTFCPCQAVPVLGVNLSLNPEPAGMEPIS